MRRRYKKRQNFSALFFLSTGPCAVDGDGDTGLGEGFHIVHDVEGGTNDVDSEKPRNAGSQFRVNGEHVGEHMEDVGGESGEVYFGLVCDVVGLRITGEDETAACRCAMQGSGDGRAVLLFVRSENEEGMRACELVCDCLCLFAIV